MSQNSQTPEQTQTPQEVSFLDRAEQALENLGDDVKEIFQELVDRARMLFGNTESTVQETLNNDVINPASSLAKDAADVAEKAAEQAASSVGSAVADANKAALGSIAGSVKTQVEELAQEVVQAPVTMVASVQEATVHAETTQPVAAEQKNPLPSTSAD